MKADTKAEREFMEQKKNKLLSDMIQNDTDKKMVQLVEAATDLSCVDFRTLPGVVAQLRALGPLYGSLPAAVLQLPEKTYEKESFHNGKQAK